MAATSALQHNGSDVSGLENKFLTFWIETQLYAIPIELVVQIVKVQDITPIPAYPHYAKGIINLRGTIIPVVDMRLRFGMSEAEYNERTCIIIISLGDGFISYIVDAVDEVADIYKEQICATPNTIHSESSFLSGIGKLPDKTALILNIAKVLGGDELAMLTSYTN